jgi:septum formation protein
MLNRQPAPPARLILASASSGRADVLRGAGLAFEQVPASIDERAIETAMLDEAGCLDAERLAVELAAEKALAVSRNHRDALVLGADQVMECCGEILHKPVSIPAARAQLEKLRSQTHSLCSGLAVAIKGELTWQHVDKARLTMRGFSDPFLDLYVGAEGNMLLKSVGSYRIEGQGIHLFSRIEGDHFTIIGLPLLPFLGYLRDTGWLPE